MMNNDTLYGGNNLGTSNFIHGMGMWLKLAVLIAVCCFGMLRQLHISLTL